jgi:hypothetical protein
VRGGDRARDERAEQPIFPQIGGLMGSVSLRRSG